MPNPRESHWVRVHVLENQFEADQLSETLKQEGISVWIKEYKDTAYDGLYVAAKGWGALYVPESDEVRAETIIKEMGKAFDESS